jgi:hypothetical protein
MWETFPSTANTYSINTAYPYGKQYVCNKNIMKTGEK